MSSLRDWVGSNEESWRVALQFVKRAIQVFYSHQDPEPYLREFFRNDLLNDALASCEQFINAAVGATLSGLAKDAAAVKAEVESLRLNLEECSGGSDLTRSRTRALSAATAVQELLIALTWPDCSSVRLGEIEESLEAETLAKGRPRFHAIEAIDCSVKALGWSAVDAASFAETALGGLEGS